MERTKLSTLEIEVDQYAVLGVPVDADQRTIDKAYHALALQLHTDKNSSPDASLRFAEVQDAYEILSSDKWRSEYDRQRNIPSNLGEHTTRTTSQGQHATQYNKASKFTRPAPPTNDGLGTYRYDEFGWPAGQSHNAVDHPDKLREAERLLRKAARQRLLDSKDENIKESGYFGRADGVEDDCEWD